MSFFDNYDGLGDIANIYGVRQRHTAITNQIENRSLLQEQTRIAREHRDAELEVIKLLRKQAESAAEKLEQTKEARKRLSQLVGALQRVTTDYTIDNIFRFAWIQSWQQRLIAADLFDEFSDIRALDDVEQRFRAETDAFRAANKLTGDPTHWAEYVLNDIETGLSAANEVLQTHWFLDPYRQAAILGEVESAEHRFKALEQAVEASLKRCKVAKSLLDELMRLVDAGSEEVLKYRDGEPDEIMNDYNAAVDTLHSYEDQLRRFEEDTLIDLRAKYDAPHEVTQITNIRRNFFDTVSLVKPELMRDRVDGLVVDFEAKVAAARGNVPEWLLAVEEFPEVFNMGTSKNPHYGQILPI